MLPARTYRITFLLQGNGLDAEAVRGSLSEVTDLLGIERHAGDGAVLCLRVTAESSDPTLIFDVAAQFGRLYSVKVDEAQQERSPAGPREDTTQNGG